MYWLSETNDTVQKALAEAKKIEEKLAEVIPENISEKLFSAADIFKPQYAEMKSDKSFTEILYGIKIW